MIRIQTKHLKLAAMLLLAAPALVFCLTWLRWYIGIPAFLLLGFATLRAVKGSENKTLELHPAVLLLTILLLLTWSVLSGQGGFFAQKSDHLYRNAIFHDLIEYDWPVLYHDAKDGMLIYYIGHWFVPALFGKLGTALFGYDGGWLTGRIALLLWTTLLLLVTFLLLCAYLRASSKKQIFLLLAVLMLFSGADYIGVAISNPNATADYWTRGHWEWWAKSAQFSSNSTQLAWVFNQSVPAWLGTILFLDEKSPRSYALIGLFLLPTSPLPLVGLAVFMLAYAVRDLCLASRQKQMPTYLKQLITIQNILAVVIILPIFALFYSQNSMTSGDSTGLRFAAREILQHPFVFLLFLLVEGLVLLVLVAKKCNRFPALIVWFQLLLFPFIRMGGAKDFCMRATIPALFVLMIMAMRYLLEEKPRLQDEKDPKAPGKLNLVYIAVCIVLLFGTVTPVTEYVSATKRMIETDGACVTEMDRYKSLAPLPDVKKLNFICHNAHDSTFYRYLARQEK